MGRKLTCKRVIITLRRSGGKFQIPAWQLPKVLSGEYLSLRAHVFVGHGLVQEAELEHIWRDWWSWSQRLYGHSDHSHWELNAPPWIHWLRTVIRQREHDITLTDEMRLGSLIWGGVEERESLTSHFLSNRVLVGEEDGESVLDVRSVAPNT